MKVAFTAFGGNEWLGGRNYLRNLLTAIRLHVTTIEPVLFVNGATSESLADFPTCEIVRTDQFSLPRYIRYLRKGSALIVGHDIVLERLLRKHQISVLSHSGHLGSRSTLPTVGWIPDLQSLHFPDFTTPDEKRRRERTYHGYCECCTRVIVSSECGRADMARFSPAHAAKAEILRFVAAPVPKESATSFEELRQKYHIEDDYLLLPNQFWAHKNHHTVISALHILRKKGRKVLVLATGAVDDKRRPDHFQNLMNYAKDCNVLSSFRVLGIIPYPDLAGLMTAAVALINPSLFEGWSTSVEESKSTGKRILLSDIPVHREQNPEEGIYFPPLDAEALADAIVQAIEQFDRQRDFVNQELAIAAFPARQRKFALRYQQIVAATVQ